MVYFLYNIFVFSLLLLALPLLPLALLFPKIRQGLGQRLGYLPAAVRASASMSQRRIWIHAASVGEINAIAVVVKELIALLPQAGIVISCTTPAGVAQAHRRLPQALAHLLLPLDAAPFLNPVIQWFKPGLALLVETELWPNFVRCLTQQGCVVMLANARMSERSYRRYKMLRPLFAEMLRQVHTVAAQSGADAERFKGLGANPQRVLVSGNTKFDLEALIAEGEKKGPELKKHLALSEKQLLIVAGSTRLGDEEGMLKAFGKLRQSHRGLTLLLAPRHLERLAAVRTIAEKQGFSVASRQGLAQGRGKGASVILLDTVGELAWMYAGAELAWIGGSWKQQDGGQNPLEASCHSRPVLFGPFMQHFSEAASFILQREAGQQLKSLEALAEVSEPLLGSLKKRQAMGSRGGRFLRERSGASRRVAQLASKLLLITDMKSHGEQWRVESLPSDATSREFGDSPDSFDGHEY